MIEMAVGAIGICAAGLPDWASASRVFADALPFDATSAAPRSLELLPPTERRRVNEISRLACLAASDALTQFPPGAATAMPSVFASSDGDGVVLKQMLDALAQRNVVVSPTAFHNSVYNAPAGYWSIGTRSTAPSTTICADRATFATALLEGCTQVIATGGPVLVVAVDAPFPEPLRPLGESAAAFACALVLEPAAPPRVKPGIRSWTVCDVSAPPPPGVGVEQAFSGNAAAAALPLLRALARGKSARVMLPYVDEAWLELEVVP